ncbi:hypothetical protein Gpo141_00011117 [Globisporangium polare]
MSASLHQRQQPLQRSSTAVATSALRRRVSMKRRMEVFCDDSDAENTFLAASEIFAAQTTSCSAAAANSSKRRNVLLCVAVQLALVGVVTGAFEGVFSPLTTHVLIVNETSGVLQRALRAMPAFVALLCLLDQSKTTILWALQLVVAVKIHIAALSVEGEKQPDRSRTIANAVLAFMLLAYPLHRMRHTLFKKTWLAPLVAVTLAESAVLAGVDQNLLLGAHFLLFNCAFLACSTFTMAVLASVSSSSRAGVLAYGAVTVVALTLRESVILSDDAFTGSLVVQLLLALLVAREVASSLSAAEEDNDNEKKYVGAGEYLFVNIFVMLAATTTALVSLWLAFSGVQYLFV